MLPGDLAWPGFNLDDAQSGDDENPYAIQSNRARASAMGLYAQEHGVAWQEVTCLRIYARPLTRQESWDHGARDRFVDDQIDEWLEAHGLKWSAGAYRDAAGREHEEPKIDDTVPPDWKPDEDDPVWTCCDRSHPWAVPGWECSA